MTNQGSPTAAQCSVTPLVNAPLPVESGSGAPPSPLRLQRKRTRGFRLQEVSRAANGLYAVCVTRPGKFGNPYDWRIGVDAGGVSYAKGCAVDFYREWIRNGRGPGAPADEDIASLRGKNLACFCKLCAAHAGGRPFALRCSDCDPCHIDVLGPAANNFKCAETK